MKPKKFIVLISVLLIYSTVFLYAEERGIETSAPPSQKPSILGNFHAFIVGINAYKEWYPLQTAVKDATALRDLLISQYGFDKVLLITDADATLLNVINNLKKFAAGLNENDNLLIFYAGHGMTNPITEEGFWIPVDAVDAIDEESWISFSKIRTLVEAKRADVKRIALITDSCYGGALTERRGAQGGLLSPNDDPESYQAWLLKSADVRSRLIISSGGLEEEVPDQSEFTDLLKMTLQENALDMIDLYHVFSRILSYSYFQDQEQTPMIETLMSDRKGHPAQFVLIRRQ